MRTAKELSSVRGNSDLPVLGVGGTALTDLRRELLRRGQLAVTAFRSVTIKAEDPHGWQSQSTDRDRRRIDGRSLQSSRYCVTCFCKGSYELLESTRWRCALDYDPEWAIPIYCARALIGTLRKTLAADHRKRETSARKRRSSSLTRCDYDAQPYEQGPSRGRIECSKPWSENTFSRCNPVDTEYFLASGSLRDLMNHAHGADARDHRFRSCRAD